MVCSNFPALHMRAVLANFLDRSEISQFFLIALHKKVIVRAMSMMNANSELKTKKPIILQQHASLEFEFPQHIRLCLDI